MCSSFMVPFDLCLCHSRYVPLTQCCCTATHLQALGHRGEGAALGLRGRPRAAPHSRHPSRLSLAAGSLAAFIYPLQPWQLARHRETVQQAFQTATAKQSPCDRTRNEHHETVQANKPRAPRPVCDELLLLLREAELEVAQLVGASPGLYCSFCSRPSSAATVTVTV